MLILQQSPELRLISSLQPLFPSCQVWVIAGLYSYMVMFLYDLSSLSHWGSSPPVTSNVKINTNSNNQWVLRRHKPHTHKRKKSERRPVSTWHWAIGVMARSHTHWVFLSQKLRWRETIVCNFDWLTRCRVPPSQKLRWREMIVCNFDWGALHVRPRKKFSHIVQKKFRTSDCGHIALRYWSHDSHVQPRILFHTSPSLHHSWVIS